MAFEKSVSSWEDIVHDAVAIVVFQLVQSLFGSLISYMRTEFGIVERTDFISSLFISLLFSGIDVEIYLTGAHPLIIIITQSRHIPQSQHWIRNPINTIILALFISAIFNGHEVSVPIPLVLIGLLIFDVDSCVVVADRFLVGKRENVHRLPLFHKQ